MSCYFCTSYVHFPTSACKTFTVRKIFPILVHPYYFWLCVWWRVPLLFLFLHPQVLFHYPSSRGSGCTLQAVRYVLLLLLPMTWFNPHTIRSPRWPPWLPAETEMGSLWSWKGWIQRPAWLCSRTTGLRYIVKDFYKHINLFLIAESLS